MIIGPLRKKRDSSTTPDGFVDAWLAAGNDPEGGVTDLEDNARIDYVSVSSALAERVRTACVGEDAQGSDHQPLWVDIDL